MVLTFPELLQRFRTKDKPSQNDYEDLIDTFKNWAETAQIEGFVTPDRSITPLKVALGPNNKVLATDGGGVPDWRDGPPASGAAGGDLAGAFPNPTIKPNIVGVAKLLLSEAVTAGAGAVLNYDGSTIGWRIASAPLVIVKDVRPTGTNGGTFTQGSWIIRTLNSLQQSASGAALSGNQLTLPAGTWYCRISCPASEVAHHKARLWNVTDSSIQMVGTSMQASTDNDTMSTSIISGIFTIASSKTFRVEHRCSNSNNNVGLGIASNFGVDEIFTEGEFRKIG